MGYPDAYDVELASTIPILYLASRQHHAATIRQRLQSRYKDEQKTSRRALQQASAALATFSFMWPDEEAREI